MPFSHSRSTFILRLAPLSRAKARAQSIGCANNLKEIGIAFKTWALDHNGQYPFNVSTNSGGTLQSRARGPDGYDRNAAFHFMVMSNELSTPRVLICPGSRSNSPAFNFQNLQSANVTYLLHTGPGINETNPSAALAVCPICKNVLLDDGSVQRTPLERPIQVGAFRPSPAIEARAKVNPRHKGKTG